MSCVTIVLLLIFLVDIHCLCKRYLFSKYLLCYSQLRISPTWVAFTYSKQYGLACVLTAQVTFGSSAHRQLGCQKKYWQPKFFLPGNLYYWCSKVCSPTLPAICQIESDNALPPDNFLNVVNQNIDIPPISSVTCFIC